MAGNHCGMNFRLLARWPSKDILPTSVACDTACEALRHYRRLRKNRMGVSIIDTWEGAGSIAMLVAGWPSSIEWKS
jgi:hypothetical protein